MEFPRLSLTCSIAVASLFSVEASAAAEARLQLNLPSVSPRPYVAVWLEKASDQSFVDNLAVWYDTNKRGNRGARWLPDMRQWWRKSGGSSSLALDGVTGATRGAGTHTINLGATPAFTKLAAGSYDVVVEVTREHGGSDLLRLPLAWPLVGPPKQLPEVTAQGKQEVGAVRLSVTP